MKSAFFYCKIADWHF